MLECTVTPKTLMEEVAHYSACVHSLWMVDGAIHVHSYHPLMTPEFV